MFMVMSDEDSPSDVNKPFRPPETEVEELGAGGKCEEVSELGDSIQSVGGEREATVEAGGGRGAALPENYAVGMNELPVVVVAEDEGVDEMISAQCQDPPLEEESNRADDAEGEEAVASDILDMPVRNEPNTYHAGDEPKREMDPVEDFTQKVVDCKVELVVAEVSDTCPLSKLQMDARGDGLEALDNKAERQLSDGKNNEAAEEVENQAVDSWVVDNNAEAMVESDKFDEKVYVAISDSKARIAEKARDVKEEKYDAVITEDIPITGVETEVNAPVVGIGEQEQVPESSGGIEDLEECVMSGTKMAEDENMCMPLLGDPTLDEPMNMSENTDAVAKEDRLPEEDIKAKTEEVVELERNVVLDEVQLADAEVVTAEETELVADKSLDNDGNMETEETNSDEPGYDLYDSPAALDAEEDGAMAAEEETGTHDTETDIAESGKSSGGKRKRGKVSKSPLVSKAATKSSSRKAVGEDVCFICFDGGELVLCDRRGCPKAYHPSCVNRDEAFFRSKGSWNCGWHLCSTCGKNARYMCYTCTFSLCKSCTKDAVILCVQGNKGFCETCMTTVKLIENNENGNEDTQIDFDDRSSWEYLFKDYYIELKEKLSLSSVDIAEAKNPWKGANSSSGPSKQKSFEAPAGANERGSGSDNSIENIETIRPKRRKTRKQSMALSREDDLGVATRNNSEWASKELLEFVSHMRDEDTSFLSQFDVQAILLEYIKRNKLRDPRRKSQIICDARLEKLFGKPRVGHFEMLKLLESHFHARDEQNDDFQGSVVDTENNQLDVDGNGDSLTKGVKDRKRKPRKKGYRGPQSNLDDYAAIDMHNIGLIYMRRKLMEDLLQDAEVFNDKILGTFVRIRISGSNQKQDLYRLVPVVGTSKGMEPYKIGKKSTDTMVEILNLDKTEIISIDTISNQEFTEEECKRLRQSIKCGLIRRLTVGEILDMTTEIQTARVNDWLESEVLRLNHLRDRASDLGRRKELRECVEKLQLLKTPEERRRRLDEIPEINADPKMDPGYESEDNDNENEDSRRDAFMRSKGISRRGKTPISPGSDNPTKPTNKIWESSKYLSGCSLSINPSHIGEIVNENSWNLERDKATEGSHNLLEKQNSVTNTEFGVRAPHQVSLSEPSLGVTPSAVETSVRIDESVKMWHYKDPSGKVQGPFSMVQLRKWNNTGYFPADLNIWRATEKEDDSILLGNALEGKFSKELPAVDNLMTSTNKERSNMDRNSGSLPRPSSEKWRGSVITNLPSPTPIQGINSGCKEKVRGALTEAVHQTPGGVSELLSSPTPVLPNMGSLASFSSAASAVMNSVIQTAPFSPTSNSQQGTLINSAVTLLTQSNTTNEVSPHAVQMNARGPTAGQPQSYNWSTTNVQNSSGSFSNAGTGPTVGLQPDVWRSVQASQPIMPPSITPNALWGAWPVENNNPVGVRPENPNMGWGTLPSIPNMGGGILPPGGNNMNWAPPPMPLPVPVYGNPGWGAPPVQVPVMGNVWGPPGGNVGGPAPAAVQGQPPQGNANQGFGPPGNQGLPWGGGGEPNNMGSQFSGQMGGRGRDSGFSGGPGPWNNNRQSSFGGGGVYRKGGTVCPYNNNGRCRKGLQCDYLHT